MMQRGLNINDEQVITCINVLYCAIVRGYFWQIVETEEGQSLYMLHIRYSDIYQS